MFTPTMWLTTHFNHTNNPLLIYFWMSFKEINFCVILFFISPQIHRGQTRIQPMQFDTNDFLIDSFICQQEYTFLQKAFKYFPRVLQSSSTQKALQNPSFNINSIQRFNMTIYQKVHFVRKYFCAHYLYNGTLGTFVALLDAVL